MAPSTQKLRSSLLVRDPSTIRFRGQLLAEPAGASAFMILNGNAVPLPLHLELRNHSPTGVSWGYEGSGPSQLALAMCAEMVEPATALRVYHVIKSRLIATIPQNSEHWEISGASLLAEIEGALAAL